MEKKHIFVICAYQESPFLEACIRSLVRQAGSADEESSILLSTSTPNTYIRSLAGKYGIPVQAYERAAKFPGSAAIGGIAEDWNHALECGRAAGGDYVTLAHQDDVYEAAYRESMLGAAGEAEENGEKPLIVFPDYYEIRTSSVRDDPETRVDENENLKVKRRLLAPLRNKTLRQSRFGKRWAIRFGNAICCPAVTYVCRNIPSNPFHGDMDSNIDWQLWEELSRRKGSFLYVPERLMGHRIHENSATSELIEDTGRAGEDLYMLKKFWPGWAAGLIEHSYQKAEKSNQV